MASQIVTSFPNNPNHNHLSSPPSLQQPKTVFISKVERFIPAIAPHSPGPAAYDGSIREKKTLDFRVNRPFDLSSPLVSKQYQWIVSDSRRPFQASGQLQQTAIGPGSYSLNYQAKSHHFHSSWGKGSRWNYSQEDDSQTILGPGSYEWHTLESIEKGKTLPISPFKGKSPSLIRKIKEKEWKLKSKGKNAHQLPSEREEIVDPEIEELQRLAKKLQKQMSERKLSPKPSSIFMSKSQRQDLVSQSSLKHLGPGCYGREQGDDRKESKSILYPHKNVMSSLHHNVYSHKRLEEEKANKAPLFSPGPGSYDVRGLESEAVKKQINLGVISKETRFKESKRTDNQVGPGHYMQKKFTFVDEEAFRMKDRAAFWRRPGAGDKEPASSSFLGKGERNGWEMNRSGPFGSYNLNHFDMQHKIDKQREQLEKLRMMEVEIPAFNSRPKKRV